MKTYPANAKTELALRDIGMAHPEATEDFPWDHRALKVRGKVFVFLGSNDKGLFGSMKLPESHPIALGLPFTEPTGYGLGEQLDAAGPDAAKKTSAQKKPAQKKRTKEKATKVVRKKKR